MSKDIKFVIKTVLRRQSAVRIKMVGNPDFPERTGTDRDDVFFVISQKFYPDCPAVIFNGMYATLAGRPKFLEERIVHGCIPRPDKYRMCSRSHQLVFASVRVGPMTIRLAGRQQ